MEARARVEPWPIAVASLLAGMMAVSLGFYGVAVIHPDAEVVEDSYVAGLHHDQELRVRQRAAALGIEIALAARHDPDGVRVEVTVTDARGRPAAAERISVRRERPAEGGLDADFVLDSHGEVFRGHVPLPRSGRWRLVATASLGGETLQRAFELVQP